MAAGNYCRLLSSWLRRRLALFPKSCFTLVCSGHKSSTRRGYFRRLCRSRRQDSGHGQLDNRTQTLLIANDASFSRFQRLRTTLKHFGLPDIPTWRYPVQALIHRTQLTFDKILLDAPCSSEKHVYNSKKYLGIWSQNRIKTLSHLQHLLINSLVPLLNPPWCSRLQHLRSHSGRKRSRNFQNRQPISCSSFTSAFFQLKSPSMDMA